MRNAFNNEKQHTFYSDIFSTAVLVDQNGIETLHVTVLLTTISRSDVNRIESFGDIVEALNV